MPIGGLKTPEVTARFLRGKLSPALGSAVDVLSGENVIGEKVTPATVATRSVVPLSFDDVYSSLKENGVQKGTALALLSIFGMGVKNYVNATPGEFAHKIAKHEKARSKKADYSGEISQVLTQARKAGAQRTHDISAVLRILWR